jgi:hypothetical protein
MRFSFLATSLRRFVDLFKPSDLHEHDNSRGQKYHLVPSRGPSLPTLPLFTTASSAAPLSMAPAFAAPPCARSFSAIIAKLLRRTHATTAKPVLSAHTLTVTTIAEIQPLVPFDPKNPDTFVHYDNLDASETDREIRDVASTIVSEHRVDKGDNAPMSTIEDLPPIIDELPPTVEELPPTAEQLFSTPEQLRSTAEQLLCDEHLRPDEELPSTTEQLSSDEHVGSDEQLPTVAEQLPQAELDVPEALETDADSHVEIAADGNEMLTGDAESNIKCDGRTDLTDAISLFSLSDTSGDEDATANQEAIKFSDERASLSGLVGSDLPKVDHNELEDEDLMDEHGTSSESSDEEEQDIVDPDVLRADWEPLRAIPERLFRLALLEHLPKGSNVTVHNIICVRQIQGGFNYVRILQVGDGPSSDRYVIKIPCTGTVSRWQESDAYMLRNDAQTMSYIAKHTDILCPEVIGFSDSLSNTLGAPYIAMRANDGMPSSEIWFDRDEDGTDDMDDACLPYEPRMRLRVNFLRSLATQMAKLQTLEFDKAGTLNFGHDPENPVVGPTYHWKTMSELCKLSINDLSTSASIKCVPAYSTSKEYFSDALNEHWPRQEGNGTAINNGRRCIMDFMLTSAPFNKSVTAGDTKETFVLRHDDLDFQNILCDEQGNVTAIIDWDKCRAAPRCLGFASLPGFLTQDWVPKFNTNAAIHMPWELIEYRSVYARAMLEATGPKGDGKYTVKSHIYQAVDAALHGGHYGGGVPTVVCRMKSEMPGTRILDDMDILTQLGSGWPYGEMNITVEVAKAVVPQSVVEEVEPWFFVEPED